MSESPLQAAKVQRPALRAETLQRDRLLDWLAAQDHARLILVTAEAGYGKTTLLADFSRRTRRRVLWYRIDENDRSWVTLVRYLIAAGQELDPDFGAATRELIHRLGGANSPSRKEVVASLIHEFGQLGAGGGAILILDDYHQIDDVAEIREVLDEFIAGTPDRLTIVFAGRRPPNLALARLRSVGAVAEIRTDDLRFDLADSERLFRETYRRALEQDVLADLTRRIDGWAACLQLVQAALRDRSATAIRAFVDGLSGATGDLHDYLAEEVVGDLQPATQQFMMRAALLQSVYPKLAAVVGEVDDLDAGRMVAETERIGLLNRRSEAHAGGRRYHPLVREFLEARLRREVGDEEVVRLHRVIANHAADTDWRLAAHHFAAAGDIDDLHKLVEASLPSIMAAGDFALAESFIDRLPDGRTWPIFDIVLSRMELHRGRPSEAVRLAESAVVGLRSDAPNPIRDQALANLTSVYYHAGLLTKALEAAAELCEIGQAKHLVAIAGAVIQLIEISIDGVLVEPLRSLRQMSEVQQQSGDLHYFGITQINIGEAERAIGNVDGVLEAAQTALTALTASSASFEIGAARLLRAWALAHRNEMPASRREIDVVLGSTFELVHDEERFEVASILADYGDIELARAILLGLGPVESMPPDRRDQHPAVLASLDIADGLHNRARRRLEGIDVELPHREPGFKARIMTLKALAATLGNDDDAPALAQAASNQAWRQGAGRWGVQAEILSGALAGDEALEGVFRNRGAAVGPWVSVLCDLFASGVGSGSSHVMAVVEAEARARPERWRNALRLAVTKGSRETSLWAAGLLDTVGDQRDVEVLRTFARRSKGGTGAGVGRALARRVAERVEVADLGRVQVRIGTRVVDGESIRRKVLALLCFLVTRPNMAAARDQVVDALWPDQDPTAASNSLNQTVYFLRRVFEPHYVEDLSPGFIRHETDVLWLDTDLVTAESAICRQWIEAARTSSAWATVESISRVYKGRFALDFEYEDWSSDYRDNLHASYLEVIERAIADEARAARFDRAIALCRRALDVDPGSEPIERQLLGLYRDTGAHAAAEEQYRHYAASVADELGVNAPPLKDL